MELKKLGELKLVEKIKRIFSGSDPNLLCGIGDDAAVLKFGNKRLLFTTDALLEKAHFDWKYTDPFFLGRKSLAVNLSDIAAMGGVPRFAVISLAIPSTTSVKKIENFYRGVRSSARQFGVSIVGGDTDRSNHGWKITIALLGEVQNPIYRSGAKVGDQVWVTGHPGFSALGLNLLQRDWRNKGSSSFIQSHLNPTPRIREGRILSEKNLASSMIDISDGLLLDLERLCSASKVGAEINGCSFSVSKHFQKMAKKLKKRPEEFIFGGGEDYELLFTSSPRYERKLVQTFKKLRIPLTQIGRIVPKGRKIRIINHRGERLQVNRKGFVHF